MLLIAPILVPMIAAGLCLLAWGRPRVQAGLAVGATAAMTASCAALLVMVRDGGIITLDVGSWPAPFGITLVADLFGVIMALLGSIVGFAVVLFSIGATDEQRARGGHFPLSLMLLAAVAGAFLTGDLFNLYVWFELMLLSSFVLLTLGGEKRQLEGAVKYVTLNLLSSIVFLASVGLIYGVVGTLNMAHAAVRLDQIDPELATLLGAPLLASFMIKAAVFPVFFWLPASYHVPPPAVSALFAGLLTKVGVYSVIRALTLMFDQEPGVWGPVVLIIAGFTMVSGVLGAVTQQDMRRILSFHIVSQIGYMLMGLGVALTVVAMGDGAPERMKEGGVIAIAGAVFYLVHHIIVKTNLFLISGAVIKVRGTSELARLGGLIKTNPGLAALFFVSAMSLAGIPVLSGFWAKLVLVRGGLQAEQYAIVAVSLVVSILTLLSMTKIWSEGFWRSAPEDSAPKPRTTGGHVFVVLPIVLLAAVTVTIGLGAAPVFDLAVDTGAQLLDSSQYVEAVLPQSVIDAGLGPVWEVDPKADAADPLTLEPKRMMLDEAQGGAR
jgi:multicomponent Na+:H+ antiporter subunit D